jgi:transposase
MEWLQQHQIQVLLWPACSPDGNPIENLWGIMKQEINKTVTNGKEHLMQKIQTVWISEKVQTVCAKLVASMASRVLCIHNARGGPTKY